MGIYKRLYNELKKPYHRLLTPPVKNSFLVKGIREIFTLSEKEQLIRHYMGFINTAKLGDGDYLEFGVYAGRSFINAYFEAKRRNMNDMNFYVFDSFQGLPPAKGIDKDYGQFKEGDYSCSLEDFKKKLKSLGVDLNKVHMVKGFYEDTLNEKTKSELHIEKASIVYVDCDLYESAKIVLDFVTDYLVNGSILHFDDWFCFRGSSDHGERRAFKEWLEENDDITVSGFHKVGGLFKSFIVHKDK